MSSSPRVSRGERKDWPIARLVDVATARPKPTTRYRWWNELTLHRAKSMNATYPTGSYWQPGSRIISRNSESISTTTVVSSIHDRLLPVNLSFIPFPTTLSLSPSPSFSLQRSLSVRKETQREGWLVFPKRKHRIVARAQNRFCELIVVTRASKYWIRVVSYQARIST